MWLEPPTAMQLIDSNFYSEDTLSLLLCAVPAPVDGNQRLIQFPLPQTEPHLKSLKLSSFAPVSPTVEGQSSGLELASKTIVELTDQVFIP